VRVVVSPGAAIPAVPVFVATVSDVLTTLLTAIQPSTTPPAADPLPWNVLLPALFAVGGALGGVLLSAFVEPLKLGAAYRAHKRQERLVQCSRFVEAATQARVHWKASMRLSIEATGAEDADVLHQYHDGMIDRLEHHRDELRGAMGQLELLGPEKLASTARSVLDADEMIRRLNYDRQETAETAKKFADKMEVAIATFLKVAKKRIH
jgi:hypothetical protein